MQNTTRDFIVGLIFFIGLAIVALFTIIVKDITILQGRSGEMSIVFDRVDGLEVGHKVLASGMEVGTVAALNLKNDGKVKVDINLVKPLKLYDGYTIKVKDASALGGKLIDINVGSGEEKLKPVVEFPMVETLATRDSLEGEAKHSLLDNPEIDALIVELREVAESLKGEGTIGLLIREREIYDNILAASQNLKEITDSIKNTEGTIGKLLNDKTLYERLDRIVSNVDDITVKISKGQGTLGKLINDDEVYTSMKSTIANADKVMTNVYDLTERIQRGEGTIGKLFVDESVYVNLEKTLEDARIMVQNINKAIDSLNSGQGTLGILLKDETMANNLKSTISSLQNVASRLEKGEGTIGKLMADDELYKEIRQLIKSFSDSVEDAREQVPITTFTNILFRAF